MRVKPKPLIVGRKVGFPISLHSGHYLLLQQVYEWLQATGKTTPEMDEAYETIPKIEFTPEDIAEAAKTGVCSKRLDRGYRTKTIRFRATGLEGAIQLLRLASAFAIGGQLGHTLRKRADTLESVSTLDQLADASR